jgi:hypothetical protein
MIRERKMQKYRRSRELGTRGKEREVRGNRKKLKEKGV